MGMAKKVSPEEEQYYQYSRYSKKEPYQPVVPLRERTGFKAAMAAMGVFIVVGLGALLYLNRGSISGMFHPAQKMETVLEETEEEAQVSVKKEEQPLVFRAHSADGTAPEQMIEFTEIQVNGEMVDSAGFSPWYQIDFGQADAYTKVDGIVTFRGNPFRDDPTYGRADMQTHTLESIWTKDTGGLTYQNASWTGSGWTGQPLMAKWTRQQKAAMNMYDSAKENDSLVEVIYACMDGYVYFLNLETGEATRDPLYLGFTFKGAGALDPRGYPILYVGAGYDSYEGTARVFIVNLLDMSVMYTFGNNDPYSLRGALSYFDSSPLVDAASDTLIYPGENGILYLIRLNTTYQEEAGTLSIAPSDVVKWRYNGYRTSQANFWLGMEDSAAIYGGYLFIADNGGHLMCLDLNTLQLVWVQDILDDSNSTPVLSAENGHLYLYVSTSFRLGWRSSTTATVPVWKIDAENGEIVWQRDYECYSEDGVSGGVQSTVALGKEKLSGLLYVTVAKTGDPYGGVLACLDRRTGGVIWQHTAGYAWSSPVCVYNEDGSGDVLYCSSDGNMYLLDGISGEVRSTLNISEGVIEASPAVYGNIAVVGTRASKIWGVRLQ